MKEEGWCGRGTSNGAVAASEVAPGAVPTRISTRSKHPTRLYSVSYRLLFEVLCSPMAEG